MERFALQGVWIQLARQTIEPCEADPKAYKVRLGVARFTLNLATSTDPNIEYRQPYRKYDVL